jgi:hypothetical protein
MNKKKRNARKKHKKNVERMKQKRRVQRANAGKNQGTGTTEG